ncbi:hypothetical protein GF362_01220 [Candidatus Dojkabacteria bacterium]|nr:hypothetical protein [Candidatus Dojkabacteria bacterium]
MTKPEKIENKVMHRDPSYQKGFTPVANVVLNDPNLSHIEFRIYCQLLKYSWQKGSCFPGHNRLAKDIGASRSTVIRALTGLKKRKLISWKQRGMNKTNIYYIEPLSDVYKNLDVSPVKHPEVSPMKHHEVSPVEHKEYEVKNNKYKNTKLTVNESKKYFKEAFEVAKELNDIQNLRYFQKVTRLKDRGEINQNDFYSALTYARDQINIRKKDRLPDLDKPGAVFVNKLKELRTQRKESENREIYQNAASKLAEKMKM